MLLLLVIVLVQLLTSLTATSVVAPAAVNTASLFTSKLAPIHIGRARFPVRQWTVNNPVLRSNLVKPIRASRSQGESSEPHSTEVKELVEIGLIPVISDIMHIFNMSDQDWHNLEHDEAVSRLSVFYRHIPRIQYAILTGSQAMALRHPEHSSKIIDGGSVVANALTQILLTIYRYKANGWASDNQTPIKMNAMRLLAVSVYHHYLKLEIRSCRSALRMRYRHLEISEDLKIRQDSPYRDEVYLLHLALLTLALRPCADMN